MFTDPVEIIEQSVLFAEMPKEPWVISKLKQDLLSKAAGEDCESLGDTAKCQLTSKSWVATGDEDCFGGEVSHPLHFPEESKCVHKLELS